MEDKEAQSDNDYYANLNRLVRYFTRKSAGYAFASIENQRHIKAINVQLAALLSEKQVDLVLFNFDTESDRSLAGQLHETAGAGAAAIIVNNLGVLVEIREGKLSEKGSNYIQELNFAREELYRLGIPILFWASRNILSIISNRAADLYTQRSINSVFFDSFPDETQPDQELEMRFLPDYRNSSDFEALELKIKLLKKQMADAEKNVYPKANIANQLALQLAKTYSEIDMHEQALSLLDTYSPYFDTQQQETISGLADIAKNANLYDKAIGYYQQAIKVAQLRNDKFAEFSSYSNLGDIFQTLGDLGKAMELFNLAFGIIRELNEANPKSEKLKNTLAFSHQRLGRVFQYMGKMDLSAQHFERNKSIMEELSKENPKSEKIKSDLSIAYNNLGEIYQDLGDLDRALQYFVLTMELGKELCEANPNSEELKNGLAVSFSNLGDIYQLAGDFNKARQYFILFNQYSKELFDGNTKSENLKNILAISHEKLGGILLTLNILDESKYNFSVSNDLFGELVKQNPDNIEYKSNYAEISAIISVMELQDNADEQAARHNLDNSVSIWHDLHKLSGSAYYSKKNEIVKHYQTGKLDYKTAIIKLLNE